MYINRRSWSFPHTRFSRKSSIISNNSRARQQCCML